MKINKSQKTTKKTIIIGIVIFALLAVAGVSAYFVYVKPSLDESSKKDSSVNYDKPTVGQKDAGDQTKESSVNTNDTSKSTTSGSDQAPSPTLQANGKGKVSATITSSNQTVASLQVRFDIGAVTNSGTCTLTLSKGSSVISKTTGVQASAGNSTCKGFDIPVSELSSGTWQVALHFENTTLVADVIDNIVVK